MIIVSQDGMTVVNLNWLISLKASYRAVGRVDILGLHYGNGSICLGTYNSVDDAKLVIRNIANKSLADWGTWVMPQSYEPESMDAKWVVKED